MVLGRNGNCGVVGKGRRGVGVDMLGSGNLVRNWVVGGGDVEEVRRCWEVMFLVGLGFLGVCFG